MVLLNIGKGVEPLNFTSYNDIVPMKQQERELELQELAGLSPSESFSEVRDELAREQYGADDELSLRAAEQAINMGAKPKAVYDFMRNSKPNVSSASSLEKEAARRQIEESFSDNPTTAINNAVDGPTVDEVMSMEGLTTEERRNLLAKPKNPEFTKEDILESIARREVLTTFLDKLQDYADSGSVWKKSTGFVRTMIDPQFHQNAVERSYFTGASSLKLKTAEGATQDVKDVVLPVINNMTADDAAVYLDNLYDNIVAQKPNTWMLEEMISNIRGGSQPWQDWLGWSEVGAFAANAIKKGMGIAKLAGNTRKMNKIAEEQIKSLSKSQVVDDVITQSVAKPASNVTEISSASEVAETAKELSISRNLKVVADRLTKTGVYSEDELKILSNAETERVTKLYEHKGIDAVDIDVLEDRDGALQTVALFGDSSGKAMTKQEAKNLAERLGYTDETASVVSKDARGFFVQVVEDVPEETKAILKEQDEAVRSLTEGLVKDYAVNIESPTFKFLESPVNWFVRLFAGRSKTSIKLSNKETGAIRAQGYVDEYIRKNFQHDYNVLDAQDKTTINKLYYTAQKANEGEGSWLMNEVNNSSLPESVKKAWKSFKDACDLQWLVKNADTRRTLVRAGVKSYNGVFGKETKISNIVKRAGYRAIDEKGNVITDLTKYNDDDFIAVAVSRISANNQDIEATHMILNRASTNIKDLPEYVINYRPGGPRRYTAGTMFVKVGRGWFNPETGTKLNGFAKTLVAGYNKKELEAYADEVNKLIKFYKDTNNGADAVAFQKLLDAEKFKYFKVSKYEDAMDMIRTADNPTGLIDPEYSAQVVQEGFKYSYSNALETAFNDLDNVDTATQELLDTAAKTVRHRGKILDTVNGEDIRLVNIDEIFDRVIRKTADQAALGDLVHWYAKDLERFMPVIKNKDALRNMGDKAKLNSVVFDTERRATMNQHELNLLRAGQKYVERARGILNSKTDADVWWENTMARCAQVLDVVDKKGILTEKVASVKLDKILRAIQFNSVMGWFNTKQLITQGYGSLNVVAMEPVYGSQAMLAYVPVRLARRLKDVNSAAYAKTKKAASKLLGVTDDEFEGLMDFLEKQNTKGSAGLMVGADRVYGDALSRDKHWAKRIWDTQYWFMAEGNAANYYIADIASWLRFKKSGKAMKADDIAGYSQSLFLGMSRVGESAFQRGQVIPGSSTVAQWMSYPMRVIEAMWDKQLSKKQRASLAITQLLQWGVSGTFGNRNMDLWLYETLQDYAGLTPEQSEIATDGVLGYVGKELGVEFDEGIRVADQFTKLFDIYDATTGEISFSQIPATKSFSTVINTFNAIRRYFQPPLDSDDSTYSWLKYVASHPNSVSTLRNSAKGMLMLRYGEMYNKYGDVLMQDATAGQAIWQMLGFRPYEMKLEDLKYEAIKDKKSMIDDAVASIKDHIDTLKFFSDYEYSEEEFERLNNEFLMVYRGLLANFKDDPEAQAEIESKVHKLMYRNPYSRQLKSEKELNRYFSPIAKHKILRDAEEMIKDGNE